MTADLQSLISKSFAAHAPRILLEEETGTLWTYGDMAVRVDTLAAHLRALGLVPGDRLLVQTEKSPHTLALYFACLAAGAIYVPLNSDYTEAELSYFIADAEPKIAICAPAAETLFKRLAQAHPALTLRTLGADGAGTLTSGPKAEAPSAPRRADDIAAILYTSGTTGKPKGAMLSHGNLASNAKTLIALWRFTPGDTLIHALPIFHVHGLFVAVHCALLSGARMIFLTKFDPARVSDLMGRASVLMGVPTFYTRLLAHPGFTRERAAGMRLFIAGSAPLSADTFRAFEARTGNRVLERYGMTETGMLTSNPYEGERLAGSVGLPLPGVSLRIADPEAGAALPRGEIGVVEVKGPNIFKGYWRNPEKTAAEFRSDGYFITGDLGFIDPNGYVHLVGRGKDLIITGGLNVYPAEVEAVLDDLPEIAEAAVIGVPHPDFGEAVVAVVRPAGAGFEAAAVRAVLREKLAGFKVPKEIVALDELPRNTMGKVQKNILRQRFAALFAPAGD